MSRLDRSVYAVLLIANAKKSVGVLEVAPPRTGRGGSSEFARKCMRRHLRVRVQAVLQRDGRHRRAEVQAALESAHA
jgi:hypothetical protein